MIEDYKNTLQSISLYQFIRYAMLGLFVIIFAGHILFPSGIGKPSIFKMRQVFMNQMVSIEDLYEKVETPDELYEDVNPITTNDIIIEQVSIYRTKDGKTITEQYKSYLESQGLQLYQSLENGYILYNIFYLDGKEKNSLQYYYKVSVTYEENDVSVEIELVEDLEEKVDSFDIFD